MNTRCWVEEAWLPSSFCPREGTSSSELPPVALGRLLTTSNTNNATIMTTTTAAALPSLLLLLVLSLVQNVNRHPDSLSFSRVRLVAAITRKYSQVPNANQNPHELHQFILIIIIIFFIFIFIIIIIIIIFIFIIVTVIVVSCIILKIIRMSIGSCSHVKAGYK